MKLKTILITSISILLLSALFVGTYFLYTRYKNKKEESVKTEKVVEKIIPQEVKKDPTDFSKYSPSIRLLINESIATTQKDSEGKDIDISQDIFSLINLETNTQRIVTENKYDSGKMNVRTELIKINNELYKLESKNPIKENFVGNPPEYSTKVNQKGTFTLYKYDVESEEFLIITQIETDQSLLTTYESKEDSLPGFYMILSNQEYGYEYRECLNSYIYFFDGKTLKKKSDLIKNKCIYPIFINAKDLFYTVQSMGGTLEYGYYTANSSGIFKPVSTFPVEMDLSSQYKTVEDVKPTLYLQDILYKNENGRYVLVCGQYTDYINAEEGSVNESIINIYKFDMNNKKTTLYKSFKYKGESATYYVYDGYMDILTNASQITYDARTGKSTEITTTKSDEPDSIQRSEYDIEGIKYYVESQYFEPADSDSSEYILQVVVYKEDQKIWEHNFVEPATGSYSVLDLIKI